jgi:hypothetical protein
MVGARLANLKDGQRKSASPIGEGVTQTDAASMLNVGKRNVERETPSSSEGVSRPQPAGI